LGRFDGWIHMQPFQFNALVRLKCVDADHDLIPVFHRLQVTIGGFLDLSLDESPFDGCQGAAHFIDPLDIIKRLALDFPGEVFN
jgi:hypothetical protein